MARMKRTTQQVAKRRGAPQGNTNSVRHGLRSGNLPKGLTWAARRINVFRKVIEDALIAKKGEVNLTDAATINTLVRYERHAILANHWLAKEAENLNPDQRLKYSEAIAKASEARDKHLRLLGLDTEDQPWSKMFDGTIKESQ